MEVVIGLTLINLGHQARNVRLVGRDGQLLTLPNYMQFLLDLEPEEIVLTAVDADAVNALAKEFLGK